MDKFSIYSTKKKIVKFNDFAEEKEPKRIFYKSSERCNLNKCLESYYDSRYLFRKDSESSHYN